MAENWIILSRRRRDELDGKWVRFKVRDQRGIVHEGRGTFVVHGNPVDAGKCQLVIETDTQEAALMIQGHRFEVQPHVVALITGPDSGGDFHLDTSRDGSL